MEYYTAVKKKEILPFSIARMNLENIILSEKASERKTDTLWSHLHVKDNEQNKQVQ